MRTPLLLLAALAFTACSGSSGGAGDGGAPDGGLPPGATTYTLTVGPLPVKAGTQAVYCTDTHLSNDQPIDVIGYTSTQTEGGHHVILMAYKTDTHDGGTYPCDQSASVDPKNGSMIYITQVAQDSQIFPPHVGMRLPAHAPVMMQTHFIDATPNDLQVTSTVNVLAGASGTVTTPAAPLLFYNATLQVPEGQSSAAASCIMANSPETDLKFFMLAGHMHSHGTDFTISFTNLDGGTSQIYQSSSWDSPVEEPFAPPLDVPNGSAFSWTCGYFNADGGVIQSPDEMCAILGNFYPAPQGSLTCFADGTAGCACFNGGGVPDAGL